jgi:transcription antitermination factor NusG
MTAQWYVVCTAPHCEPKARRNLLQQRYRVVWLKCRERIVRPTGRVVDAIVSLFPRYLFVHLSESDPWHPIKRTPGVTGIIMRDPETPAALPERVAKDLFARADCTGLVDLGGPKGKRRPSYRPGSEVKILGGPFEGFTGEFLTLGGESRAQVLVHLLGRPNRLWLDESQIGSAA